MMEVPWLPNDGIPGGYTAHCMFNQLCEVVLGQEQVDEVITRDIHRWGAGAGRAAGCWRWQHSDCGAGCDAGFGAACVLTPQEWISSAVSTRVHPAVNTQARMFTHGPHSAASIAPHSARASPPTPPPHHPPLAGRSPSTLCSALTRVRTPCSACSRPTACRTRRWATARAWPSRRACCSCTCPRSRPSGSSAGGGQAARWLMLCVVFGV